LKTEQETSLKTIYSEQSISLIKLMDAMNEPVDLHAEKE
jgi:hypothetical protein